MCSTYIYLYVYSSMVLGSYYSNKPLLQTIKTYTAQQAVTVQLYNQPDL